MAFAGLSLPTCLEFFFALSEGQPPLPSALLSLRFLSSARLVFSGSQFAVFRSQSSPQFLYISLETLVFGIFHIYPNKLISEVLRNFKDKDEIKNKIQYAVDFISGGKDAINNDR